eukprot:jgi/Mesvir1/21987/Mv04523-RA.1
MPRTWVFVDLDQCAKDATCIDTSRCTVVGYCGKAYEGPVPAGCEVMRSDSMIKEAADTLFHYDLGKRIARGVIDPYADQIYVLSRDAAWHNAGFHLLSVMEWLRWGSSGARRESPGAEECPEYFSMERKVIATPPVEYLNLDDVPEERFIIGADSF